MKHVILCLQVPNAPLPPPPQVDFCVLEFVEETVFKVRSQREVHGQWFGALFFWLCTFSQEYSSASCTVLLEHSDQTFRLLG